MKVRSRGRTWRVSDNDNSLRARTARTSTSRDVHFAERIGARQ